MNIDLSNPESYTDSALAACARRAAMRMFDATPVPRPWSIGEIKRLFLQGLYPAEVAEQLELDAAHRELIDKPNNICLRLIYQGRGRSEWREYALEARYNYSGDGQYARLGRVEHYPTAADVERLLPSAWAAVAKLRAQHGDLPLTFSMSTRWMPLGQAMQGLPVEPLPLPWGRK